MRERALERDDNPPRHPRPLRRSFSFLEHDSHTDDDDDQHRPPHPARGLPAPARCRPRELHPRVGRAGPARPQLVDGSRLAHRRLRRGDRARAADRRLPRLRPRGAARADGAAARGRPWLPGEPRDRLRHARPLRPRSRRGRGARRRCRGDRRAPRGGHRLAPRAARHRRADPALARPRPLHRDGRVREGAHRRGRRLPVRPLAAGRAADVGHAARRLPGAPARQPVALPVPARARRDRARRLLARAARRLRERPRQPLPDRGHDRADRGRRRAAPLVREGPRRARDARRPRPQRPLARLQGRHRARRARHGGGALLARLAPRLGGRRRAARRRDAVRGAPRVLPRGHRQRRPQGARDAAHLRARRVPPWPVRRRRAVLPAGWDDGRLHRVAHDGDRRRRRVPAGGRRRRRRLRPGRRARGVPKKLAALEAAIDLAEVEFAP